VKPCDPAAIYSIGGGAQAWVNYIGRGDSYGSAFHDQNWRLTMNGIQAGVDLCRSQHRQLGILVGYEIGRMSNAKDRVHGDDLYAGAYAARVLRCGTDIRGSLAYGWQSYDMNRFAHDHLYTSSFKGRTTEGHLELGKCTSGGPLGLRPVAAVDVLFTNLTNAAEANSTGGLEAVEYGKINLTQIFLRTGIDLRFRKDSFTLDGGIYYSYDINNARPKTSVMSVTDHNYMATLVGAKLGRSLATFNLGGACQITERFSTIGGYQGEYVIDRSRSAIQSTYYLGGAWQW
jgi:hypothetical protein